MKLSGYGLLFRGVQQVVQGTALGVTATFGIGETPPPGEPGPALLERISHPGPPAAHAGAPVPPSDRAPVSGTAPDPARARTTVRHAARVPPPDRAVPEREGFEPASPPPPPGASGEHIADHEYPVLVRPIRIGISSTAFAAAEPSFALPLGPPASAATAVSPDMPPPAALPLLPGTADAAAATPVFPHFPADVSAAPWLGDPEGRRVTRAAALAEDGAPQAARGPLSTAPDRDGDEPAGEVVPPGREDGAAGAPADGQAKERDLLSLETLSRGGLALSGGYSSVEGPIGSIRVSRTNIGAPGRDISASARYSKVQTLFELGVSDSNVLGSRVSLAPTFFYSRTSAIGFDKDIEPSTFRQRARGINLYVGKPLDYGFRVAVNYRLSDENFFIRQKNALCDVGLHGNSFCNAIGPSRSSVFSLMLSLDRRDSRTSPTRGFQLRLIQDVAGPGGTTRYIRMRAAGSFHRRFGGNLDVSLGLEGGYMRGFNGREVPLFDRFYIGGNSMRGFDLRGLGPKVIPTAAAPGQSTAIGGRAYYVGRLEISARLGGRIDKFGVSPSLFVDAGSVFGAPRSEILPGEILQGNSAKPRVAVGFGLSFNVAPGKLRFNIARPLVRQEGDRPRTFSISFGTAF